MAVAAEEPGGRGAGAAIEEQEEDDEFEEEEEEDDDVGVAGTVYAGVAAVAFEVDDNVDRARISIRAAAMVSFLSNVASTSASSDST